MRLVPILLSCLFSGGALAAAAAPSAASADKPTVSAPTGGYQTAWIDLQGAKSPARLFLALRDGRPAQAWCVGGRIPGGPEPKGSSRLLVDALRGETKGSALTAEVDLRLVSIWAPMAQLGRSTLTLAGTIGGGQISGTWRTAGDGGGSGAFTGTIRDEAAARAKDAIAAGQDWPWFYGVNSALRAAPYGKPLIEDLAQACPLWRSEVVSLSGWGTGVDSRYKKRAALGTLCGGSSSPIVADGRVYLFHTRPSGDSDPSATDAAVLDEFKDCPPARESMRLYFSQRADVVVTCLDAVDGHTLWESVWPRRQANIQTHKWRGNNCSPAIAQGVVLACDYGWGLYAHDARDGHLLWSRGGGGGAGGNSAPVAPLVCGDVVVWATGQGTAGLDLKTGAQRWQAPAANSARGITVDGKAAALLVARTLVAVDPATGAVLAKGEFPTEGRGLGDNLVVEGSTIVSFDNQKGDAAGGQIVAFIAKGGQIAPSWRHETKAVFEDGHTAIAIANGTVFCGFQQAGAFAIDLATGKTLKTQPSFTTHSNPIHVTVDDRLLWQPECQHGSQHMQLFDATSFTPLGGEWSPPHNHTTAYGEMAIANVVVDGRLIIRGMDGLYCYDLRR